MSEPVPSNRLQDAIRRSFPRNLVAVVGFDAVWALGMPSCMIHAVVPIYLLFLGSSKTYVQATSLALQLFAFFQLWSHRVCAPPGRPRKSFAIWTAFSSAWLVYGLLGLALWPHIPRGVWRWLFSSMVCCLAVLMHLGSPAYGGMVVENTPPQRRGLVTALRSVGLGLFALLGMAILRWIMGRWPEPLNLHVRFVVGSLLFILSCLFVLTFRDHAGAAPLADAGQASTLGSVRSLFSQFNFRVFLLFHAFLMAALSIVPLLIAYGKDVLAFSRQEQEGFVLAYFIGLMLIGSTVPFLADRFGFRLVAMITGGLVTALFIIPVVAPGKGSVLASYTIFGGAVSLSMPVLANLGAELVPSVRPATIIAVGSSLTLPLTLAVAPAAGRLADLLGKTGYLAAFIMGATLAFCSLLGFVLLVREPRTGQEIHVRFRPARPV